MAAPIFKRQLGHLSVAVFENERQAESPPARSISVTRRYFDRQAEEWKSSSASLNPADVPAVIKLMTAVEAWLVEETEQTSSAQSDG